ncbi:MAG TPA: SusD/RagB family nutrient-binding outer membrane lipoprotein [Dinghuibacter sp.]|jgi:hypothetical protein|uniref:SusD/RagB family nutrient-binding outer membrane lipoprotein n=1 Tax=Dinghuibacter sp. TaxID=2024697 RepID=UPI002CB8175C|nr:SusD/RagB family nutrient-binding outer membrane lipoprotein [Dinghuibacter sp.]HTJ13845.1 SusD/RagB family nutrient-binding outer membrane lipoprotein [Dinghuibacter sp.]
MKLLNKYIAAGMGLAAMAFMGPGCKRTLNINTNPNFPTYDQGTPAVVFPAGVLATTGYVGGDLAIVGGMWSQFFAQSAFANQYTDVDSYNMPATDGFVDGPWDNLYTGGLLNYQFCINSADSTQDWTYYLMATVMKAYTTEVLVDLYDQIPYTQALEGKDNLQPKFDSGFTVYQALIASLDDAMGKDFTANTNSTVSSASLDPIFSGDIDSWIAFANTLKLKMYLRMVNAQPALAQSGIQALYTGGATFLTKDAAFTNFTDNPGKENPMYEQNIRELNTGDNLRASTTFVSWLVQNSDPRVNSFFGSSNPYSVNQGDYHGADPTYSKAAVFVETSTDPVEFISTAESYFMQAEADVRYFGGSKAKGLYEQGVTAAFSALGLDASSYIAPGGVYAWGAEMENGAALTPLQQILRQKWAAAPYGCHGIESYFDFVRTGFPTQSPVYSTDPNYIPGQLVVGKNSVLPAGELPKRFVFPYDERSRNTNTPAQVPMQTPVWWGK